MRCQASTAKGTKCTRQGYEHYPICALHIRTAMRDLMRSACGESFELFVITTPEPEWEED